MKKIRMERIIVIVAAFQLTAACSSEMPSVAEEDLVVVRAYLYAGQPVTDIKISGTIALGSQDTTLPPINDAEVYLVKDGQQYDLVPSPGDSGYYHYEGGDLTVESGDEFDINVIHGGRTAWGTTTVPEAPENISASTDSVVIPESFFLGESGGLESIVINWDEIPSALWFVVLENIEANPEPVERGTFFGGGRPGLFITPPRTSNEYTIRSMQLTHYGLHRVRVYRINQEYADLYSSRQQDTRDLNEPLTNIINGLGIFSAFSSQEVLFYAAREP